MTEQEWLTSEHPLRLLDYVRAPLDTRKSFLVAAACFRRHWERLPEVCRDWARRAEAAAEGKASRQELDDAFEAIEEALNEFGPPGEFVALLDMAWGMWAADWPYLDEGEQDPAWLAERKAQAVLVREVFGNPFRPVTPSPAWRTENVIALARAADAGAVDALPELVNALRDAGCDNGDVLAHLREPGPHVRGCCAVDLVLGRGGVAVAGTRACALAWLVPWRRHGRVQVGESSPDSSERSLTVVSADEALAAIRRICQEVWDRFGERVAVSLEGLADPNLYAAVVGDRWHFWYVAQGGEVSLRSVGDKSATGTSRIIFSDFTDVPNAELVSQAVGEEVVRVWFEEKHLSDAAGWRAV